MERDLELKMARLEVKLLRAQFNSHFLFNNLSAINYRILNQDPVEASKYLNVFSRLLRRTLADSRSDFVALSDEIETLGLYIEMENMRFDRRIEFVVTIEPDIAPDLLQLPSLMLHTYMEKAIWRSLLPENDVYTVRLGVDQRLGRYHLTIEDFGSGPIQMQLNRDPAHQEFSLKLVEERMLLLNERHGIDIRVEAATDNSADENHHSIAISFDPFFVKNKIQETHY